MTDNDYIALNREDQAVAYGTTKAECIKALNVDEEEGTTSFRICKVEDTISVRSETRIVNTIRDEEGREMKLDKKGRLVPTTRNTGDETNVDGDNGSAPQGEMQDGDTAERVGSEREVVASDA